MTLPSHQAHALSPAIRLLGVRQNNLKGFDLDIPIGRWTVITGLSGSGKSSLAFETLYAEGQRRYIETFTPYARQFFDRMDKPAVDRVENIPPAIAVEQRNTVRSSRSTVGTMTEIADYLRAAWPQIATLYCRSCGGAVRSEPAQRVADSLLGAAPGAGGAEAVIAFPLRLTDRMTLHEQLTMVAQQGFHRLWLDGEAQPLDAASDSSPDRVLFVVTGRTPVDPARRSRIVEACEQAYQFGGGCLTAWVRAPGEAWEPRRFSAQRHCAKCDLSYREPSPALFSFNHPVGACPECKGFGRVILADTGLAIPDRRKTLREGAVRPWQSGVSADCQRDMLKMARRDSVPLDVPFDELSTEHQSWVIDGQPGYGTNGLEWPNAWYGVRGYFRWLESKAYKMHMRVLLSRYRSYHACPRCRGRRLNDEALLYRLPDSGLSLADFSALTVAEALALTEVLLSQERDARGPSGLALREVKSRLGWLGEVGLGYLALNRPTRTLSGGETQRVNLTHCVGARLVNTLLVLDEPSVGLHPRDTERLVRLLGELRDRGNTLVVVEHDPAIMRAADWLVDIGPGRGAAGGEVVFAGAFAKLPEAEKSLTAKYLTGTKRLAFPERRPVQTIGEGGRKPASWLRLEGARANNLQNITVEFPLARLTAVTGVSGSGKSSLIREELLPRLRARLTTGPESDAMSQSETEGEGDDPVGTAPEGRNSAIFGAEALSAHAFVDQTPAARTPRSNPAVYLGAFDDLRALYAAAPQARSRGWSAGAFSFNSKAGQCPRCSGAGFEKIEMQFLSDVYLRCPACDGRRYKPETLEVKIGPGAVGDDSQWTIADLLDASVDEARSWLRQIGDRHALRAATMLTPLAEVGLGYLRLGQPLNTLSGGESQRLKLARHLADFEADEKSRGAAMPTLLLLDEPTTGLHFDDVRVLLGALSKIVDRGHSVVVVEHNLDVIAAADWVIDLGPDAGARGGNIVACGTPEWVSACPESQTGRFLKQHLAVLKGGHSDPASSPTPDRASAAA